VGITKFCVHPDEWFRSKIRVGGTKTLDLAAIRNLNPDLILANKEENTKEQIVELSRSCPVWVSDIQNVEDAICMIRNVGVLTGTMENAISLTREIKKGLSELATDPSSKRVAYLIWKGPWMAAGGDTYISDMITRMGWHNIMADRPRYPEVNLEELASLQLDMILLSSEPFPFKEKHIEEIKEVLPNVEVLLVDGEMFSWYGSRLNPALKYLKQLAAVNDLHRP
jgi:ABC-type Fe3+-hydroxamate transport system substrate-binding protein